MESVHVKLGVFTADLQRRLDLSLAGIQKVVQQRDEPEAEASPGKPAPPAKVLEAVRAWESKDKDKRKLQFKQDDPKGDAKPNDGDVFELVEDLSGPSTVADPTGQLKESCDGILAKWKAMAVIDPPVQVPKAVPPRPPDAAFRARVPRQVFDEGMRMGFSNADTEPSFDADKIVRYFTNLASAFASWDPAVAKKFHGCVHRIVQSRIDHEVNFQSVAVIEGIVCEVGDLVTWHGS